MRNAQDRSGTELASVRVNQAAASQEQAATITRPADAPPLWLNTGGVAMLTGGSREEHTWFARAAIRHHLDGKLRHETGDVAVLWAAAYPGMGPEEARLWASRQLGNLVGNGVVVHGWSEDVPATRKELGYIANAEGAELVVLDTTACLAGHPDRGCSDKLLAILRELREEADVLAVDEHSAADGSYHCDTALAADFRFFMNEANSSSWVKTIPWSKQ